MEYAVVADDLAWMLIENHHGAFFVAGDVGQLNLAFSKPDEPISPVELPTALKSLREDLRTTVHIVAWQAPLRESALLGILGFERPWGALNSITREEAHRTLAYLAAYDLAYDCPADSIKVAEECARVFVESFAEDCLFLTNFASPVDATARSWRPLTNSTFDGGVIAIASERGGVFWFEDED
jgi:hypothetical protein